MKQAEHLDYTAILEAMQKASTFDLFRLKVALNNMLQDPQRAGAIRAQLRIGETLRYFDADDNREYEGVLLKCKRKTVDLRRSDTGALWSLPYYMLNLESRPTEIREDSQRKLTRQQLCIGERVGFKDRQQQERVGEIVRLNDKTVTLIVDGGKWRVGYGLLYRIIDTESHQSADLFIARSPEKGR